MAKAPAGYTLNKDGKWVDANNVVIDEAICKSWDKGGGVKIPPHLRFVEATKRRRKSKAKE